MITNAQLGAAIAAAAERYHIPGVVAAVVQGDERRTAAHGVLNVATGVEATTESVFQVGSITKVFTGTLVMQLVDAGLVELDAPIGRYLPALQIDGAPIADTITVRTLLAHTSGIIGDFFIDTGDNVDATERYIERCTELRYFNEPGHFSYCNSGYAMLGRLIEVVGGAPWVDQLRTKLLRPLGITALTDPVESMLFRTAAGHVLGVDGAIELTKTPFLPRSTESVGARLTMSPSSLLRFASMHLRDGLAEDGTRVLSAASARAMRELIVQTPVPFYHIEGYGLSWAIRDSRDHIVGHNGGTIGQSAFLLLFPESNLAVSMLTNVTSGTPGTAFEDVLHAVTDSVGITLREAAPRDLSASVELEPLAGRYRTGMSVIDVTHAGDALHAEVRQHGEDDVAMDSVVRYELELLDAERFDTVDTRDGGRSVAAFVPPPNGETPRFLFWGGRLAERVTS